MWITFEICGKKVRFLLVLSGFPFYISEEDGDAYADGCARNVTKQRHFFCGLVMSMRQVFFPGF